jgi:energy-converting hydrogenase Eha subunit A
MIKKMTALIGLLLVAAASVSCNTTDAKVGLPIPFTDPPVRVNLETQVTPLPPKICVGLDVVEN